MDDKLKEIKEIFNESEQEEKTTNNININGDIGAIGNHNTIVQTTKFIERKRYILNPGEEHISEEQAFKIKELVHEAYETGKLVKKNPKTIQAIWTSLNRHCKVTSYRAIKSEDFNKAITYLRKMIGMLNAAPSAHNKNPDWRKKRCASIHTVCKRYGFEEKRINYMKKNFSEEHLTNLNDEDLDRVYRYVHGLKKTSTGK